MDRFVTIGRRTARFCFGLLMRCLFFGLPLPSFGLLRFVLVVCFLFGLFVCLFCLFLVLAVVPVCFDDVVTGWTVYRSYTRSLLKPLNLQAAMFALISQFTLVCNMQLNVLDDLAEAMKALDGKKIG